MPNHVLLWNLRSAWAAADVGVVWYFSVVEEKQIIYGYNIESVAELNDKMEDDIKVLLYEYRAAFKNKNKAVRKN